MCFKKPTTRLLANIHINGHSKVVNPNAPGSGTQPLPIGYKFPESFPTWRTQNAWFFQLGCALEVCVVLNSELSGWKSQKNFIQTCRPGRANTSETRSGTYCTWKKCFSSEVVPYNGETSDVFGFLDELYTTWKIDMEPQNWWFVNVVPVLLGAFFKFHLRFRGCMIFHYKLTLN